MRKITKQTILFLLAAFLMLTITKPVLSADAGEGGGDVVAEIDAVDAMAREAVEMEPVEGPGIGDTAAYAPTVAADTTAGSYSELSAKMTAAPAGSEYVIEITGDFALTGTLGVASGQRIVLRSEGGGAHTLTKSVSGRHFTVNGSLTLANIVLDGGGSYGGVQVNGSASFAMRDNAVIQNCAAASSGGAVYGGTGCAITVADSTIRGNTSGSYSGGIYAYNDSVIAVENSAITDNTSINAGGAICGFCDINVTGGRLSGNTANLGGAIYITKTLTAKDVEISGNISTRGGGGIAGGYGSSINVIGGSISDNRGGPDGGGAIYANQSVITISGTQITGNGRDALGNASATMGGAIHANYRSVVDITGSTISGNIATGNGGGIHANNGTTVSLDSVVISGSTAGGSGAGVYVGGVYGGTPCSLTMRNSAISGNTAAVFGGGVYVYTGGSATMYDGSISGNAAATSGGGVYIHTGGNATLYGGSISGNTASTSGGGVYVYNTGVFTMNGGAVSGNGGIITTDTAAYGPAVYGGGMYVTSSGVVAVTGTNDACSITDNSAPNGHGGGIYSANSSYGNLTTAATTVFRGNSAAAAYAPPADAAAAYPALLFAGVSISDHVLNNFDVNYTAGTPLTLYTLTYDANGGEGAPPDSGVYEEGKSVAAAGPNTLALEGHTFDGWLDDAGTLYRPGDILTITGNITLYAQWKVNRIDNIDSGDNSYSQGAYVGGGLSGPGYALNYDMEPPESGVTEPKPGVTEPELLPPTGVHDVLPLWMLGTLFSAAAAALLLRAVRGGKRE